MWERGHVDVASVMRREGEGMSWKRYMHGTRTEAHVCCGVSSRNNEEVGVQSHACGRQAQQVPADDAALN